MRCWTISTKLSDTEWPARLLSRGFHPDIQVHGKIISVDSGMLTVMLDAFGAHGLRTLLDGQQMSVYQTGVQYHFYHTLLRMGVGLLRGVYPSSREMKWSGWFAIARTLLFSGSLYLLSVTGVP